MEIKDTRVENILKTFKSFQEEEYSKDDLISEYLQLEKEIVNLTFNKEHAENADLQLYDVQKHLINLNEQCEGIISNELNQFIPLNTNIRNNIKKYKSGYKGERKVFNVLETLKSYNITLKNIELKIGNHHTEYDSIVITKKAIFIIEVKNSKRDILIDEKGDLYRNQRIVNFDSNLGVKMNDKEYIIRNLLQFTNNDDIKIEKLVVFTNSPIKVENNCKYIKHCYLSDLPHIIDEYEGEKIFTKNNIFEINKIIKEMEIFEKFKVKEDIEKYKLSFANTLAKLECFAGSDIGQIYVERIKDINDDRKELIDSKSKAGFISQKKQNRKWLGFTIVGIISALTGFIIGKQCTCK